jgi:hypothetical protein
MIRIAGEKISPLLYRRFAIDIEDLEFILSISLCAIDA